MWPFTTKNIGHALGENPYNTIASALSIWNRQHEKNFLYWEVDLNTTLDGKWVCYHNGKHRKLSRDTNNRKMFKGKTINQLTFKQTKLLTMGKTHQSIPSIIDLTKTMTGRLSKPFCFEIKWCNTITPLYLLADIVKNFKKENPNVRIFIKMRKSRFKSLCKNLDFHINVIFENEGIDFERS